MNQDLLKSLRAVQAALEPDNHSEEARIARIWFPEPQRLKDASARLTGEVVQRLKEVHAACAAKPPERPVDWPAAYDSLETISEFMDEVPAGAIPTIEAARNNVDRQVADFLNGKPEDVFSSPIFIASEHAANLDPRWKPLADELSEVYDALGNFI